MKIMHYGFLFIGVLLSYQSQGAAAASSAAAATAKTAENNLILFSISDIEDKFKKPWIDLPPSSDYETLSDPELISLIDTYHNIPKTDKKLAGQRLEALIAIKEYAEKKQAKRPNELWSEIIQVTQNKTWYLFQLLKQKSKINPAVFRVSAKKYGEGKDKKRRNVQPVYKGMVIPELLRYMDPARRSKLEDLHEEWLKILAKDTPDFFWWLETKDPKSFDLEIEYKQHGNKKSIQEFDEELKVTFLKYGTATHLFYGQKEGDEPAAAAAASAAGADDKRGFIKTDGGTKHPILDGKYHYAIDEEGDLYVAKVVDRIGVHSDILQGASVLSAGEITFKNGHISEINNKSGHYMPSTSMLHRAVKTMGLKHGINIFTRKASYVLYLQSYDTGEYNIRWNTKEEFQEKLSEKNTFSRPLVVSAEEIYWMAKGMSSGNDAHPIESPFTEKIKSRKIDRRNTVGQVLDKLDDDSYERYKEIRSATRIKKQLDNMKLSPKVLEYLKKSLDDIIMKGFPALRLSIDETRPESLDAGLTIQDMSLEQVSKIKWALGKTNIWSSVLEEELEYYKTVYELLNMGPKEMLDKIKKEHLTKHLFKPLYKRLRMIPDGYSINISAFEALYSYPRNFFEIDSYLSYFEIPLTFVSPNGKELTMDQVNKLIDDYKKVSSVRSDFSTNFAIVDQDLRNAVLSFYVNKAQSMAEISADRITAENAAASEAAAAT